MSRFYIGQRVRIARSTLPFFKGEREVTHRIEGMVGKEATVAGTVSHPNAGFDPHGPWDTSIRLDNGIIGMVPGVILEPATDSYDKVCWEDCLWKPDSVQEAA